MRHVIVLLGLFGTAYFLAVGVGALIAGALPETARACLPEIAPPVDRDRFAEACQLLEHQAFDERLGTISCLVPDPPAPPDAPRSSETSPEALAECSDLPRRLVGTLVQHGDVPSFAAIADASGRANLLEEGAIFAGATVAQIDAEAVVLETGGSRCTLTMFAEGSGLEVTTTSGPGIPAPTTDPLANRVRRLSDSAVAVDRALVDELLADPTPLLTTVRLIPHEEDGRVVGMRVYGLRAGTLLHTMGLRNGDTLRAVNGIDLSDTSAALMALGQLRDARSLEVTLDRRGTPSTLRVEIE